MLEFTLWCTSPMIAGLIAWVLFDGTILLWASCMDALRR
jgi:hypothetical protein